MARPAAVRAAGLTEEACRASRPRALGYGLEPRGCVIRSGGTFPRPAAAWAASLAEEAFWASRPRALGYGLEPGGCVIRPGRTFPRPAAARAAGLAEETCWAFPRPAAALASIRTEDARGASDPRTTGAVPAGCAQLQAVRAPVLALTIPNRHGR